MKHAVMIRENPDIYRIRVPLTGNPLKNLNVYVIKSKGQCLVIDTGFNTEECKNAFLAGLAELDVDITTAHLYITHMHFDHMGLADLFMGEKNRIYMGEKEYKYYYQAETGPYWEVIAEMYVQDGFPEEELIQQNEENPAKVWGPRNLIKPITLRDGETVTVGDVSCEVIEVPGHTPGNTCLYIADGGIMFLGDHVLFDITPNITLWLHEKNSLKDYLGSLDKIQGYDIELALPAHREQGQIDLNERINEIKEHHVKRLEEIKSILLDAGNEGLTGFDVASRMTWSMHGKAWKDVGKTQKWFAMGEARSHLQYLAEEGTVAYKDGKWYHI